MERRTSTTGTALCTAFSTEIFRSFLQLLRIPLMVSHKIPGKIGKRKGITGNDPRERQRNRTIISPTTTAARLVGSAVGPARSASRINHHPARTGRIPSSQRRDSETDRIGARHQPGRPGSDLFSLPFAHRPARVQCLLEGEVPQTLRSSTQRTPTTLHQTAHNQPGRCWLGGQGCLKLNFACVVGLSPPGLTDKFRQSMFETSQQTTRSFRFADQDALVESQDIANKDVQVEVVARPHILCVVRFAAQPLSAVPSDTSNVGNQQRFPFCSCEVATVQPSKPRRQLWKGFAHATANSRRNHIGLTRRVRISCRNCVFHYHNFVHLIINHRVKFAFNAFKCCIDLFGSWRDHQLCKLRSNPV